MVLVCRDTAVHLYLRTSTHCCWEDFKHLFIASAGVCCQLRSFQLVDQGTPSKHIKNTLLHSTSQVTGLQDAKSCDWVTAGTGIRARAAASVATYPF